MNTSFRDETRSILGPKILWRKPQNAKIEIPINIVNDSAFVTFTARIDGIFHILEIDTSVAPDTIVYYQKAPGDNFVGYAIFKRYLTDCSECLRRGWQLENISGVEVNSDFAEAAIDSIRINCESYEDTVLTDPWVFFKREKLLALGTEEEVTLTIYSSDCVYGYMHAVNRGNHWRRWKFEETEPGILVGYWITSAIPGIKGAAFDVLNKYTLDDEIYKHDSNIWIFPYRVE